VFQAYSLFPHLTARENVEFGMRLRRRPAAERRRMAGEMLDLVGIGTHADRYPHQLSGGQQQRVALARALAIRPQVLLLDEPLSALDAKVRVQLRDEIRRIQIEVGTTTLFVTHDQEEALALADRLVVLREGEVQQVGSPEEVYAHPANRYVAGFMGYRNMIPVAVHAVDGDSVTVRADGLELVGVNRDGVTGGDAVAAIRPEDFTVAGADVENTIPATVEIVEYHGREQVVEARLSSGQALHVRTTSRLAPGDEVRLAVPAERVLVFAREDSS
jgi:putative spermidine/putrescine transport system ATP-binding protein